MSEDDEVAVLHEEEDGFTYLVALAETLLVGDGSGRSRVAQLSTSHHQGFVWPRFFERLTDGRYRLGMRTPDSPNLEVGCAAIISGVHRVELEDGNFNPFGAGVTSLSLPGRRAHVKLRNSPSAHRRNRNSPKWVNKLFILSFDDAPWV